MELSFPRDWNGTVYSTVRVSPELLTWNCPLQEIRMELSAPKDSNPQLSIIRIVISI